MLRFEVLTVVLMKSSGMLTGKYLPKFMRSLLLQSSEFSSLRGDLINTVSSPRRGLLDSEDGDMFLQMLK